MDFKSTKNCLGINGLDRIGKLTLWYHREFFVWDKSTKRHKDYICKIRNNY